MAGSGKDQFKMDIERWQLKCKNVTEAVARAVQAVLEFGLETVYDAALKNLDGPRYGYTRKTSKSGKEYIVPNRGMMTNSGVLPVPVLTGQLKKSLKKVKFSTVFGAVYSDHREAIYNKAIHYGYNRSGKPGAGIKPRPFLQAAIDERRPAVENRFRYEIYKEMRRTGRA